MSSTNWSQYAAAAKEHGGGPTLPEGSDYHARIVKADAVKSGKSGKFKFTWTFEVLTGPFAGKREVLKQYLSPESGQALAIFRRTLKSLGIDMDSVPDGTPEAAVANMAVGGTYTFDIKHKANPGYDDEAQFYSLKRVDAVTNVTPPVQAPAAVAPAAVVAPVQDTVAPAAPVDLAAQLAALQAQIAAGAASGGAEAPAAGSKLPW